MVGQFYIDVYSIGTFKVTIFLQIPLHDICNLGSLTIGRRNRNILFELKCYYCESATGIAGKTKSVRICAIRV